MERDDMSDTKQAPVLEWREWLDEDGDEAWDEWSAVAGPLGLHIDAHQHPDRTIGKAWRVTGHKGRAEERIGTAPTLLEAQLAAEQCAREWLAEGLAKLTLVRQRDAREAPLPCFATGCACWGKEDGRG